jgi:hypothetical protein
MKVADFLVYDNTGKQFCARMIAVRIPDSYDAARTIREAKKRLPAGMEIADPVAEAINIYGDDCNPVFDEWRPTGIQADLFAEAA